MSKPARQADFPPLHRPRVSILIAILDGEATLRQCLDSALSQTLRDLEVVCVDDGSSDGSAAILAEYAARDARVKTVRQANAGLLDAHKTAVGLASGEWCVFLDPDDWLEPDACELLVARAEAAGADMASCGCILHPEGNPPEELLRRMDARLNPAPWSGPAAEALPLVFTECVLPWNLIAKTVRTGICKAAWAETSGARHPLRRRLHGVPHPPQGGADRFLERKALPLPHRKRHLHRSGKG